MPPTSRRNADPDSLPEDRVENPDRSYVLAGDDPEINDIGYYAP